MNPAALAFWEVVRDTDFRRRGYRSAEHFLSANKLVPEDVYNHLRRGIVTDEMLRVASREGLIDQAFLRIMRGEWGHRRYLDKPTTTVDSVISAARRRNNGEFFDLRARDIFERYSGTSDLGDEANALRVLKTAVLQPRIAGDYRTALINGVIVMTWLIDRLSQQRLGPYLVNAFLVGLARTAGQVEHRGAHRYVLSLAKEIWERDRNNPLALRSLLDIQAGYEETEAGYRTSNSRSRDLQERALNHYDEAIVLAAKILQPPMFWELFSDQMYSVAESYLNRSTARVRLNRISKQDSDDFSEMNEKGLLVESLVRQTDSSEVNVEAPWFHRMLQLRYLLGADRVEEAVAGAAEVVQATLPMADRYPFLVGKANLLAGTAKMRIRQLLGSSKFDDEILAHRAISIEMFDRVGNHRESISSKANLTL